MSRISSTTLRLYSTLAVQGALEAVILPAFREAHGRVAAVFDPSSVLLQRIADGHLADALIATTDTTRGLIHSGVLDSDTLHPIARVGIGVAVRRGEPVPDISTPAAFATALCTARSVGYSASGASGKHFARLLTDLGIAEQVNAAATVVAKGITAHTLIDGRCDLAVQQISELRLVPGVTIIGELPPPLQHLTEFAAAAFRHSARPSDARQLIAALATDTAQRAYRQAGLQPTS